jgi:dipeptidyl-peptidase 4
LTKQKQLPTFENSNFHMKNLHAIALSILLCINSTAFSQNKILSMEDAILKGRGTLGPKTLRQIKWMNDERSFSFTDVRDSKEVLYSIDASTGKETKLLTITQFNQFLQKAYFDTMPRMPELEWESNDAFQFMRKGHYYRCNLSSYLVEKLPGDSIPDNAENKDFIPIKTQGAYTLQNNLYVYYKGKNIAVTNDKNENIVNGKSVHRNEFGITKGTFWSPDHTALAFYRMDESMVKPYPIVNFSEQPAAAKNIRYPMAGDSSHQVTIGIYNLAEAKTIWLQTGEPKEQFLTNIAWSPDAKKIYVAVLNRDQNHMKLNAYDAKTGKFIKTLFEEKDERYVEPQHPMLFVKNNPSQFLWQSNRDGFNHVYLYNVDGSLIKQITKGNWDVSDMLGFNEKGDAILAEVASNSGLDRVIILADFTGKQSTLSSAGGIAKSNLSKNGKSILYTFTSLSVPQKIFVCSAADYNKQNLVLESENPLKDYAISTAEIGHLRSIAGDTLHTRLFKPINFDASKKYPVVVYLYGGPHAQMINNGWLGGANLWFEYMAQNGFVVFTLDNRGSGNRGKKFEQATFRKLGTVEMEDQLSGLAYLKTLGFVDTTKMGVHGWSFGGFMTTTLMTKAPNAFKVGVAGGPVIDWGLYEIMYTERYMDTPQQNPEGYKQANLLNYTDKLKGKLLMIHGTVDDVVVWQHSIKYLKKAVDKNIQMDYFVYPEHPHNVLGKDRVHLMNKVSQYFFDHLK